MTAAATPAIAALRTAGVPHEVVKFEHDPRQRSYGPEAVEALTRSSEIEPEQIYKTLVIAVPNGFGLAVLPVPARLSLKAAASALAVPKATMADQTSAQRVTGYVVGAISPLGQRRKLPTVVDESALGWDRVLCSAGRRGWDVAVSPADLIRLTSARVASIQA